MTQSTSDQSAWPTASGTIRRGMKVLASDGTFLGTVEAIDGEEILLAGSVEGAFVALSQVDGVSEEAVLLSPRGDATFGLGAQP
ncbi:hypothetical protein WSK_0166 [Novosphingobium sp. Rr 2-17]|uniref:DUF2171 domain-containing protein n=1 Tax=Novosphingobium sp. Rr 2-17 TaxID=555793 RepID=UPI0002697E3F|nr:DUF2171 domain-containing protein [Novosphingobium sp. Rr 2-17]EIZ81221.1 hypothetical protein WSK_0166 [Novosphingobium sp. Rr 2-17]